MVSYNQLLEIDIDTISYKLKNKNLTFETGFNTSLPNFISALQYL